MSFLGLPGNNKLANTFRKNPKTSTNQGPSGEYDGDETRSDAGFDAYFEGNINEGVYGDIERDTSVVSQAGNLTDMRIAAMTNLLEEVTLEVTEANKQHKAKLPLKQDGMQSRYEKRSASTGHPIADSFCPQPLQPRSRTLAETGDNGEGLVEALKASEPIAILQEQHLLELEKQKAIQASVQEASEQEKQKKGVIGTLKRKVSSTFQKDTTEQHKSEDQLISIPFQSVIPSPSQSALNSLRKHSASKAAYRGDTLPTISEHDAPPNSSTIASSTLSPHPNEQAATISPRESGYSGGGVTTSSPQAKSPIPPKPSLTINASKANEHALSSRHVSPAVGGTRSGPQSAVNSQVDLLLTDRKSSATAGNTNKPRRRLAAMSSPAVPDTPMRKREKFKPDDPRVKMVERAILREEFGVNTTRQLTSEYRIVPPTPKEVPKVVHSNSWYHPRPESNPFNREEAATSYSLSDFQFDPDDSEEPAKDVGTNDPVVQDSVHPHYSFESTASDDNTYTSQGSTFPSSDMRTSADTIQSFTVPETPDTPSTGISSGIPRKDFGTQAGTMMSPLQPVGRPVWSSSTNSFGEDVTNSARISTGRVAGRSLTDPFDFSATDNTKNEGFGNTSGHKVSHSPGFSNVAFKPEPLKLRKFSDQTVNESNASLGRGIQVLDFGSTDDRTMSPGSPANTITSGPNKADGKENRVYNIDTTNYSDTANTGPLPQQEAGSAAASTHTSQNISERDFQNASKPGIPSNRLKHEDEAEEERRLKELSKEDHVAYKVAKLRKETNTEKIFYNETDDKFPKHPNHERIFHSKNLWCTECRGLCAVCEAACCAWMHATNTSESSKSTCDDKLEAGLLKHEIERWVVYGTDDGTFLSCTECYKLVCTDCIGICPIAPCFDRVCANCNPGRLWQPCEYHDAADWEMSAKIKREMQESGAAFN